ncbi:serine hydrolase [Fulvivirgaceae bacterium BMA10]|uniref:Serine hydrolase n=1 Tax=Splendidivirga corallicola TaxID=3051826 RepID=A0ABT8KNA4_9BACT|nr:serine hydrolase [Fulvivirgaceae bacterium BMA10]
MKPLILILSLCLFSCSNGQTQAQDRLRQPIPGLPFASLEDSGFDKDSIENLLRNINDTPPSDFRGLVVIKNNRIVIEEYFNTFWRNSIHDIRSAGKSVTSMLLGIALKDGLVQNLEQDVYSFFPENKYPSLNEDYRQVKLKHLLDMSSGLDADTDRPQTTGHAVNWIAKDNWKDYLLNVPLTSTPGKKWVYADINPLLIAAVIEETSGMSLKDYARKKLFGPLGIEQFYWYTNAANQTGAAGNLYISTLDFAKLGVLVLNEGRWKDTQIIDPDYIKSLSNETFDLSDNNPYADAYGMLWYKSRRTFGGKKVAYLFASGNGGNHLIVIPKEEMVIALTSSAYGQRYAHRRSYNIMGKILASLK